MKDYVVSEKERHELANYLKKKREKNNWGLNQFCLKANIQSSQYSRLENGQLMKINPFLLQKIASALKIDYRELYKIVGYLDTYESTNVISNMNIPSLNNMIQVPVYDSISAGVGREPNSQPVDFLTLPKDMVEGCVIINIHGDGMEPTLQIGSRILVKLDTELNNNDIGVFIYEDEALLKRYKVSEGKIYLYSDNPQYLPKEVRKGDRLCICGKVMWIMNRA